MAYIIVLILSACLIGYIAYDNTRVVVKRYTYTPKEKRAIRICHITDFHNQKRFHKMEKVLKIVETEKPDIVVCSGDFFEFRDEIGHEKTMELFTGLSGLVNHIVVTTGNHDVRAEDTINKTKNRCIKEMWEHIAKYPNIYLLRNEIKEIEVEGRIVEVIGIEDPQHDYYPRIFEKGNEHLVYPDPLLKSLLGEDKFEKFNTQIFKESYEKTIAKSKYGRKRKKDSEITRIMSYHRPELMDIYVEEDIDYSFAGHAHGGLIKIPIILKEGIVAPNQGLFPKYTSGIREKKGTVVCTSAGVGGKIFGVGLRIFNPSEVVIMDI